MATIRVRGEGGSQVNELTWRAEELEVVEKPNGPAAAALIAAGVGALALGILTVLNEASEAVHDFLELDTGVGPLSGKTTFAVISYVVAWALLSPALWRRNVSWSVVLAVTGLLLVGGLLGTFPEFFKLFASE